MSERAVRPVVARTLGVAVGIAFVGALIWRAPDNGWGSLVWTATAVVVSVIRARYSGSISGNVIVDDRRDGTERFLLALVGVGSILVPLFHLLTGAFDFASYELPVWTIVAGAMIAAGGLWLFWRSHADLGLNWSPTLEVREAHTLVTEGVYARIRHPMYTSLFLIYGSFPLLIHNWVAGWIGVIVFGVLYVIRISNEERMMNAHFGAEYASYSERTGRLVPPLRRRAQT